MTRIVRGLLSIGNGKLGSAIHTWSLPAIVTCPGATDVCRSACYATKSRFLFPAVRERLQWNYEQSLTPTFADRLAAEVKRKGCLVIRVHVSGDYFSPEYCERWLWVMRKCPRPRYYWYSRSWVIPELARVLEQMAALRCCRAWYSVDALTGLPDRLAPGIRLAYLMTSQDEEPENVDLLFRVRKLRRKRLALPMAVCPHEDGSANCGGCQKCFQ